MPEPYIERRSKRALAIDRAIQAKKVYHDYTRPYRSAPNRSDVQDYDTALKRPTGAPAPPLERPTGAPAGYYKLNRAEKIRARRRFHELPLIQQHKDLLHTRNVIKSKRALENWHKNPRQSDIWGIDTRPVGLEEARVRVAHKHAKRPPIHYFNLGDINWGGYFNFNPKTFDTRVEKTVPATGLIVINPKTDKRAQLVTKAHEIGHALEFNLLGGIGRNLTGYRFTALKSPKIKGESDKWSFLRQRGQKLESQLNRYAEKYTGFSASNYSNPLFHSPERFARWFSGYATMHPQAKRMGRGFYNVFRKSPQFKPLVKEMRLTDYRFTSKFMGGKGFKAGWWKL